MTDWLIDAYKKLAQLGSLANDWDSYGAEAPSRKSIDAARRILQVLVVTDTEPTSIDPSAEGGVCLSFQRGNRYSDIECFNSGEILAVTSAGSNDTNIWEIEGFGQPLYSALSKVCAFVTR